MDSTQRDAIWDWVTGALGIEVVWARQPMAQDPVDPTRVQPSATPPKRPYASLDVTSSVQRGDDEELLGKAGEADESTMYFIGQRRATLTVAVYDKKWHDPLERLETLRKSRNKALVREGLQAAKISIVRTLGVNPATELKETAWEGAAMLDFELAYVTTDSEEVGHVEEVGLSITLGGVIDETFTVTDS